MIASLKHKNFFKAALDLVYPRQCQLCGETNHCDPFPFLCKLCSNSAPRLEGPACAKCGLPVLGQVSSEFQCSNCSEMDLCFDSAVSAVGFRGVVRHAIHGFKYSRQIYWGNVLAEWFVEGAERIIDFKQIDLGVPVPLHSVRERERGFNQAWVLAEALKVKFGLMTSRRCLKRVRPTETQTHLDRQQRISNLNGAFEVSDPMAVKNKSVLLIDDVLTTGSTASECGRVLYDAGARSVLVFTLARGY
jgi:competence protein ComFC